MIFKFEINTDKLNYSDPESIEQTIKDFQMLIQFLCNSNSDYYIIGEMLKEQMEKQVNKLDPKQDMITQWDMILERDTGALSREAYCGLHNCNDIPRLVTNFYAQIGEAMGPVCYAGILLIQALKAENMDTDWVHDCIKYYENNWNM